MAFDSIDKIFRLSKDCINKIIFLAKMARFGVCISLKHVQLMETAQWSAVAVHAAIVTRTRYTHPMLQTIQLQPFFVHKSADT